MLVAVTDDAEGLAALRHAAREARERDTTLTAVDLTASGLDDPDPAAVPPYDVVVPDAGLDLDEVEHVLHVLEERPDVTLLVVGVRPGRRSARSSSGASQRLILEAPVPVLAVEVGAR